METTALDLLRRVSFFTHLDGTTLCRLADRSRRRRFGADEALFHQNDPGQTLYVVVSGRVRIQKITASGETVHLAHRGPGEHFGELALLDGQPRMADAVTATPCELLMLDREAFVGCIEASPRAALAVMESLAARLRQAADVLESQRQLDVPGRLAEALLELAAAQGEADGAGPVRITARVTHQALADQIGATRESVSRALAGLRDVRAVRTEGRALILLSPAKLRRLCGR